MRGNIVHAIKLKSYTNTNNSFYQITPLSHWRSGQDSRLLLVNWDAKRDRLKRLVIARHL